MRIIYIIVPAVIIFVLLQINISRPIVIFNCATCKLRVYSENEKLTQVRVAYLNDSTGKIKKIDIEIKETELDVCQLLNENYSQVKFDNIVFFWISVNNKGPGRLLMRDKLMGKDSLIKIFQDRS